MTYNKPKGQITRDTVDWYLSRGFDLTPLADAEPSRGKRPRYKDWVRKRIDPDVLYDAAASGLNLGWVIPKGFAILDIDLKHGGAEGKKRIEDEFGVLSETYPVVVTGSGGWHAYCAVDDAIEYKSTMVNYPGVDLRQHGTQCVIPGSYHYDADAAYEWSNGSPLDGIPAALHLGLAVKFARPTNKTTASLVGPGLSNEELKAILDQIPAEDFAENNVWFTLMCASHHATGGTGLAAFVEWSLSDTRYAGHEHVIEARWASLSDKPASITYKSLLSELYKHKGKLDPHVSAKIDFVDAPDISELHAKDAHTADGWRRTRDRLSSLTDRINALGDESGQDEIESVLQEAARDKPLNRDRAAGQVAKATGRSKTLIKKMIERFAIAHQTKALLDKDEEGRYGVAISDVLRGDVSTHIAIAVVDKDFERGRTVCRAPDGSLWEYVKTHWTPLMTHRLDQCAMRAINEFACNNPGTSVNTDSVSKQAVSIVAKIVRSDHDLFNGAPSKTHTVINTLTYELWVHNTTGDLDIRAHDPASNQLGVVDIKYDPRAECPLFLKTLDNIFRDDKNRTETIRHLIELFGYTIQTHKNLAAWVMLRGEGSNGKTILFDVLTNLAGGRVMSVPIREIDSSKSAHVVAALVGKLAVIDDDVSLDGGLPDGALKKLSENKIMTANPKFKDSFEFNNTAICYLAANHWPYVKDGSLGMRRRANIFELNQKFDQRDDDYDPHLVEKLRAELPGILNLCIDGLRRLRARTKFDLPVSCRESLERWLYASNPIHRFLESYREDSKPHSHSVPFTELWDAYKFWSIEEGMRNKYQRAAFKSALQSSGLTIMARGMIGLPVERINADRFVDAHSECDTVDGVNELCRAAGEEEYTPRAIKMICANLNLDITVNRGKLVKESEEPK